MLQHSMGLTLRASGDGIGLRRPCNLSELLRKPVYHKPACQRRLCTTAAAETKKPKPRPGSRSPPSSAARFARVYGVEVPFENDPGKDDVKPSQALREALRARLGCEDKALSLDSITIVRKSFDARKVKRGPLNFVYVVDVDVRSISKASPSFKLKRKAGRVEDAPPPLQCPLAVANAVSLAASGPSPPGSTSRGSPPTPEAKVGLAPRDARQVAPSVPSATGGVAQPGSTSKESARQTAGAGQFFTKETAAATVAAAAAAAAAAVGGSSPKAPKGGSGMPGTPKPKSRHGVVVVGCGPAGLLAALTMAEAGIRVTLVERGMPVEGRGRDIGALFHRHVLNPNSNLCYGEGGAGTWSDGKLTTQIGKNSSDVQTVCSGGPQTVLRTLVYFGAPERILVDGKPHLGTDRLVHILRNMRAHLMALGVTFLFDTAMDSLVVERGRVTGVRVRPGSQKHLHQDAPVDVVKADAVVLAVGHSAREVYTTLLQQGVHLEAKDFAVGFRVEHPQSLIDEIQYGRDAAQLVQRGGGKIPVADYKLTANNVREDGRADASGGGASPGHTPSLTFDEHTPLVGGKPIIASAELQEPGVVCDGDGGEDAAEEGETSSGTMGEGEGASKPVPGARSCFSFCMCPGGQIVPTSVTEDELCINGMSFSKRSSLWANSALVVSVTAEECAALIPGGAGSVHPALVGVEFQRAMEHAAAALGGGGLVAPVQTIPDFLSGELQAPLPASSYRLGVKAGRLDQLFPRGITSTLAQSLHIFNQKMPGFIHPQGLLHGVETRTSSPLRIPRKKDDMQSVSMPYLFPSGEGAGYAGGIMSSAVDGMLVGQAVIRQLAGAQA
eukprot:jgi/Mesvir1/2913/Mv13983-RA.1